jgi:hypothetical protein
MAIHSKWLRTFSVNPGEVKTRKDESRASSPQIEPNALFTVCDPVRRVFADKYRGWYG